MNRLGTLIWVLVASAVCLPVIVPLLPKLLTTAVAGMVLVLVARAVWFFTR